MEDRPSKAALLFYAVSAAAVRFIAVLIVSVIAAVCLSLVIMSGVVTINETFTLKLPLFYIALYVSATTFLLVAVATYITLRREQKKLTKAQEQSELQ